MSTQLEQAKVQMTPDEVEGVANMLQVIANRSIRGEANEKIRDAQRGTFQKIVSLVADSKDLLNIFSAMQIPDQLPLEMIFPSEEIDILVELTATQIRAEMTELDVKYGNPYRMKMREWIEKSALHLVPEFKDKVLAVADKYDAIPNAYKRFGDRLFETALQRGFHSN